MTKLPALTLAAASLAGLLAACGGSASSSGPADPKFQDAAPTYDKAALQIDASDAVAPASAGTGSSSSNLDKSDPCHPQLFIRTHEIVERINRHTLKLLRRIEAMVGDHPRLKTGEEHIWDRLDAAGIQHRLTVIKTSTGYSAKLELAAAGSSTWVTVFTGDETDTSTTTGTNTVVERKGTMSFNFDALQTVIPTEKARGHIDLEFDLINDPSQRAKHIKRVLILTLTGFVPEEGDPHGPRTGGWTHVSEPGVGGSLQYTDSLVLFCPANPQGLAAETKTVARWYWAPDGSLRGRADANATGGQIPANDTFVGLSCHQGPTATTGADAYWMMKLEDAHGASLQGSSDQTSTVGAVPCDQVFGPVPSLTDNKTDYVFTSAPVTFQGEW
jgi:hypothetical protein